MSHAEKAMPSNGQTCVALLTPPGRAAVSVLAVEGPCVVETVGPFFYPANRRPLAEQAVGQILFGHWVPLGKGSGPTGEEVVVCRLKNEHENERIEVHCHGGPQAAKRILDELVAAGCQAIDWQTWIDQHAPGSLEAEAHEALACALTRRGAAILLDQYQGALRRELTTIRNQLVGHSHADSRQPIADSLEQLLQRSDVGLHLTQPWNVLVAGRPNVGKSSLVNAILGYSRAIVFDQPGTTRDVLSANTAMGGWPVRLSDTAGIHRAADKIESRGIELAFDQLRTTDMLVWVVDATDFGLRNSDRGSRIADWPEIPQSAIRNPNSTIVVLNKIDLVAPSEWGMRNAECGITCYTSATTGEGVESLVEKIAMGLIPHPPAPGDAVPFTEQQQRLLLSAKCALETGDRQSATARIDELLESRDEKNIIE